MRVMLAGPVRSVVDTRFASGTAPTLEDGTSSERSGSSEWRNARSPRTRISYYSPSSATVPTFWPAMKRRVVAAMSLTRTPRSAAAEATGAQAS